MGMTPITYSDSVWVYSRGRSKRRRKGDFTGRDFNAMMTIKIRKLFGNKRGK